MQVPARSGVMAFAAALALFASSCRTPTDPQRYRLAHSGDHWDVVNGDRVVDDLLPRYPEFFAVILDPSRRDEASLRHIRDDLERAPTDRRNFDALNAVAVAYFEINHRAEFNRGVGLEYLSRSMQAAKLLAVPWRAYSITEAPALREAILDFFEDAGSGEKLASAPTAPRLVEIVASLESKESNPGRRARIQSLSAELRARYARELPPER